MAPKIFLTGVTGYIGGTAHAYLAKAHPEYEFTLLVRDEKRAEPIKAKYPNTKFIYGSLEDEPLVENAAAEADIIIHTADSSDNTPGARAIAKGIEAGHSAEKPGYWIHLSGTSILTWYDRQAERYGDGPVPEQKYHDINDIERIVTLPDEAHHRDVDIRVQKAISPSVKVAIICPPTIYGKGSGVLNTRSIQVPDMVKGTLVKGFAPIVGAGKTEWDNIHIDDLADLYVRIVEATQDPTKNNNPKIFGLHGYFFAANGVHKWSDIAKWIAEEARRQGYLPESLTKSVTQKEVEEMDGVSTPSYGQNSKGVPERAKKYLGWQPTRDSLKEQIPNLVHQEAKTLGLTPDEAKA